MTNFVIGKIKIPQCLCKTVENMRKCLIFGQQDFERACHVRVENKSERYIYWQDMEIFMGSAWGGGEGSSKIHKHLSMIWNIMKKEIFWCFDNCNKKKTGCPIYSLEQRICRQKILWKEDPVVKVMRCILVFFVCGRCPSVLQCVLREQCGLSDMESGLVGGWRLPRGILRRLGDAMRWRKTSKVSMGDSGVGRIRQCAMADHSSLHKIGYCRKTTALSIWWSRGEKNITQWIEKNIFKLAENISTNYGVSCSVQWVSHEKCAIYCALCVCALYDVQCLCTMYDVLCTVYDKQFVLNFQWLVCCVVG